MYKKRRIRKKNAKLYGKQGLLALTLLILTIYLGVASSLMQGLFPPTIKDLSKMDAEQLSHRNRFVKLQCDRLYYTGYDNHKDSKITGHYYYAMLDNHCFFFLINSRGAAPKNTLDNYEGTFFLNEDEELYHDLTASLAKDMNWASKSLRSISPPFIFSQPDYHFLPMILYALALLVCTIIFTVSTIANFSGYRRCRRAARNPEHHNHSREIVTRIPHP